jgi:hypothetical protein
MSKEKRPSYPRYYKDYLSDINVMAMTLEEEGMYNRLLDFCWAQIELPRDPKFLAGMCKGRQPSELVLSCFIATPSESDPNAIVLRSKKLDEIRKELNDYKEMQSRAGQIGNQKRWGKRRKPKKIIAVGSQPDRNPIAEASPASSSSIASSSSSSSSIASAGKREKASHFVPEDFAVTDQDRRWANETRPDLNIELETEKFRNYEFKNTRTDWRKTWKNWILNAKGGVNGNGPKTPAVTREQAAKQTYQMLVEEQNAGQRKA